jgi:DNA modification methylase
VQQTSGSALPAELARRLIAHYSDPGQLVIAAGNSGAACVQARRLGRRALPYNGKRRANEGAVVIPLRSHERADLALLAANKKTQAQRLAERSAQISRQLKAGGFLVLALAPDTHAQLGALVGACQQHGLQYWQHIVAIDANLQETDAATAELIPRRARDGGARCHRDLLVFRRASENALAGRSEAVAFAERAA